MNSALLPYLALLRTGFAMPPLLPAARCALTAPFHPYPLTRRLRAVYFLWHFPWACAPQALPGVLSTGARTFLPPHRKPGNGRRSPGRLVTPFDCGSRQARTRTLAGIGSPLQDARAAPTNHTIPVVKDHFTGA